MSAATQSAAVAHTPWCVEHRPGDPGDPGFCTSGGVTTIGGATTWLDQDQPGGEPRICLDSCSDINTLSLEDSRRLRGVLEDLERRATPVDKATLNVLATVADAAGFPVNEEDWRAIGTQADAHAMALVLGQWLALRGEGTPA